MRVGDPLPSLTNVRTQEFSLSMKLWAEKYLPTGLRKEKEFPLCLGVAMIKQ